MKKISKDLIPLKMEMYTFLVLGQKPLNTIFTLFRLSMCASFLFSTLTCIDGKDPREEFTSKFHDSVILLCFLLIETTIVMNRDLANTLVDQLLERFQDYEPNSIHQKITEDCTKEVKLYCKVVTNCTIIGALFWNTISFILSLNNKSGPCTHLVIGWVFSTNYDIYLLCINVACSFIVMSSGFQWFLILYCLIIKTKSKLRLLCADLDSINDIGNLVEVSPNLETQTSVDLKRCDQQSAVTLNNDEEDIATRIRQALNQQDANKVEKLEDSNQKDPATMALNNYSLNKMKEEQVKMFFERFTQHHIGTVKLVRLTDKTFKHSILVTAQLGGLIVALAISQLTVSENLANGVILLSIEAVEILGSLGLFCYFGQVVMNESDSLFKAVSSSDWTDKPRSLRQGLLIVLTMATRPLRLTIGGVYTLGMETYGNILQATYSYTSLIYSFKAEGN